ncbi:ATP-binding protein [Desulfovibrio subterraneus]|uniref:Orc1-like AAA ATPase domain-containing protein n=1 Tax=Desulfovibrio subterraneus TaxID=2718620 RepID=A0A7J0BMW1_9BACT|nr:ATP-binding protein [Desulfovibrio subterraneus]GFM34532.1 hypothetical protein DSM101010T_28970 [Desulfovibrio subterraneus]
MSDFANYFRSENDWPFVLREHELTAAMAFLDVGTSRQPKILRLFGPSGSGKSFFVRELLTKIAHDKPDAIVLYLDTPPSDLEASQTLEKLGRLLKKESIASRTHPVSISRNMVLRLKQRNVLRSSSFINYLYGVFRDLIGQIPVAGPIVKALLPQNLPMRQETVQGDMALFNCCLDISNNFPVLLALDNIQFLSTSMLEILRNTFAEAGCMFCFVVIERTKQSKAINWHPEISDATYKDIYLEAISEIDTLAIARAVLPGHEDLRELAKSIHRRSEGNLKSIWFQLKFTVERIEKGEQFALQNCTYENIVQSLPALDQFILRTIVILLGGLSIAHLIELFKTSNLGVDPNQISWAINDMMAMGLLVLNSESHDKIKIEHERVASAVTDLTPEDEKMELREQVVKSIVNLLAEKQLADDDVLYDRLIGNTHEQEVRSCPKIQTHIVNFINTKNSLEQFTYLSTLGRDTVCWDIIDILPSSTIAILMNAVQKCSLFHFGLILAERCKKIEAHRSISHLYEAKYLVQLFHYELAQASLQEAKVGPERNLVAFNILINLNRNDEATRIARSTYKKAKKETCSEFEYAILRSSGHLFKKQEAKEVLEVAISGFHKLGSDFGVATTLSNLAIVEMVIPQTTQAERHLDQACTLLQKLMSNEIYQPLVNLSGIAILNRDYSAAERYLHLAKGNAPRSLAMDTLMFEYNEMAVAILAGKASGYDALETCLHIHHRAQKTKDIRFIETLGWFTNMLSCHFGSGQATDYSSEIIEIITDTELAGLELLVSTDRLGPDITVPYILSPHWRY